MWLWLWCCVVVVSNDGEKVSSQVGGQVSKS